MKLEIFGLIEAHFGVRSSATDEKIAEKQHEKINFWPDGLPPQQICYKRSKKSVMQVEPSSVESLNSTQMPMSRLRSKAISPR